MLRLVARVSARIFGRLSQDVPRAGADEIPDGEDPIGRGRYDGKEDDAEPSMGEI